MAIPIYYEGEDFYVPYFEVKLEGRPLGEDIVRDIMQVTYTDSTEEIDSFELVINNWDAESGGFKYEPPSLIDNANIFDPGQQIELWLGYLRNIRLMLRGRITTLEPNFPEGGGSTLSVRGLNVLHALSPRQHTGVWENKRDSDIAVELGRQPLSENNPGLGIEVRTDSAAAARETEEVFVFMNNQYDILFLIERARRHGYTVYMDVDGETGEHFVYFGPSDLIRDVTYELEWGKSLSQFKPTLTTTNQIQQVTVRGWNRRTREPIEGTATIAQSNINRDQQAVANAVQGRHEVITDRPVHTPQEAERLARDILNGQLREMIKASGATVGLPDLRSGSRLHIKKLGDRFDGVYFVTKTTHTIGENGYRTTFDARREGPLPG